jgi:hypothetical protein
VSGDSLELRGRVLSLRFVLTVLALRTHPEVVRLVVERVAVLVVHELRRGATHHGVVQPDAGATAPNDGAVSIDILVPVATDDAPVKL